MSVFDHPRRLPIAVALILGGLLGIFGLRACTPSTVVLDMHPTERALGHAIGAWLKAEGCASVVILETRWSAPHLNDLAKARAEGLAQGLEGIPSRVIYAQGPAGRLDAWNEARAQSSPNSALVSAFGMPGKATYPPAGAHLVLVGEADGSGLPPRPAAPMPCRTIKPRLAPTAPVWNPTWKGTDPERFAAYYDVADHPSFPARRP